MKFVAEDGKVFDTMEECEKYEKKSDMSEMAAILDKYVVMVNFLGKVVKPETDYKEDCEKFLAEFEKIMICDNHNGAKYVIVYRPSDGSEKKVTDALDWFSDYAGIYIPCKPGVWRWDEDEEWVDYGTDYLNFRRMWEKVESYL